MDTFYFILFLFFIIGVSNILNHFIPFIPVPLFQVTLGVILAVIMPEMQIQLEPELFFVLFVAPLLFNDGKRIPREELWNLKAPILMLALGLVFATVFVVGFVINWLIPSIPLPAAFALAAILSPTDAVAVSALAGRIHLPKSIIHLLEGEALMNDASGLVAFKFAIAAAVTGAFSIYKATISFFIIAVGGILIGAVTAFLIIRFKFFLRQLGMEDITMHMLIQILTPFAIYMIAEHMGVSGILAVVAGGIIHAVEKERTESVDIKMQIVSTSTWSVILFILNGLVFVILGLEIPKVLNVILNNEAISNYRVTGYIIEISIALYVIRFLWIFLFSEGNRIIKKTRKYRSLNLKSYVLTSVSGVRGAVTLAGAFSIPLVLQDGTPFPERDLIIFISAGVILFTLVTASILLPLLTESNSPDTVKSKEKIEKIKLIRYIICALESEINDENKNAVMSVVFYYRRILTGIARVKGRGYLSEADQVEKQVRILGLRAEKKEIESLVERGKINNEIARRMQDIINHIEVLLSGSLKNRFVYFALINYSRIRHSILKCSMRKYFKDSRMEVPDIKALHEIKVRSLQAAVDAIKDNINAENRDASMSIISYYDEIIQKVSHGMNESEDEENYNKLSREIHLKALRIGRDRIHFLYKEGEISREMSKKLRQFINQNEAFILEKEDILHLH